MRILCMGDFRRKTARLIIGMFEKPRKESDLIGSSYGIFELTEVFIDATYLSNLLRATFLPLRLSNPLPVWPLPYLYCLDF
jgi:hypothetical protein